MEEDVIDLRVLYYIWLKKRKQIILLVIVGFIIGSLFATVDYIKSNAKNKYLITTSLAITTINNDGAYINNTINPGYNDIQLAQDLASSVIYVAKSDRAIDSAMKKINIIGINPKTIQDNLEITQYDDTQIITLKLYWDNDKEGIQIVKAISEVVPNVLIDTLQLGSVKVVDYPKNQGLQTKTFKFILPLAGAIIVAGLYVGICFLEKIIHTTITDSIQAEKEFKINCLGTIPECKAYFDAKPYKEIDESDKDVFVANEALTSVSLLMKHIFERDAHKCYYITSSLSDEGKTSIGANLGIQLSQHGKKVLLIDFDIRKPSLGHCFFEHIDHEKSLNAVYHDNADIKDVIQSVNPNLDIIATRVERNKIFIDKALMDKIKPLKEEYDLILIDAAPIGIISDTLMLNELADKAIMVIRYDYCWISKIRDSIDRLTKSGIDVCGTIISGVHPDLYTPYGYRKYYDSNHD